MVDEPPLPNLSSLYVYFFGLVNLTIAAEEITNNVQREIHWTEHFISCRLLHWSPDGFLLFVAEGRSRGSWFPSLHPRRCLLGSRFVRWIRWVTGQPLSYQKANLGGNWRPSEGSWNGAIPSGRPPMLERARIWYSSIIRTWVACGKLPKFLNSFSMITEVHWWYWINVLRHFVMQPWRPKQQMRSDCIEGFDLIKVFPNQHQWRWHCWNGLNFSEFHLDVDLCITPAIHGRVLLINNGIESWHFIKERLRLHSFPLR